MFDKILVPLDGSALAEGVLPHALALSQAFRAAVEFVHVLDHEAEHDARVDPLAWHMLRTEGQSYLQTVARRWEAVAGPVETILLEGAAADRIVAHAREQKADLIVLSSHGRSGMSEWNVSSVVQKVIMRAFRSVFFVRAALTHPDERYRPYQYRRLLIPLDGSRRAEGVLPLAQKLLEGDNATALLIHMLQRPVPFRQPPAAEDAEMVERYIERNGAEAAAYLEEVCGRLGPRVSARVEVNDSPATALADLAESAEVDMVLLSAHGRTTGHNPYGGVASGFIHYGSAPLLIYQDLPEDQMWLSATASARAVAGGRMPASVDELADELA